MACSWKAALRSWLGVLVALAITVVISVLIRTFNLFCSDPLDDLCSQRHATLTVTVLMACLWVVGKPHCAVVAMFPVILLPMMGVGGKKYALDNQYFNHVNFILLGNFLLAFAIEEVGLHHRLALKLLSMVPGDPKLVLLAMMCISALLSAFMSNTATASLMCPLATSLYEEIKGVPPEERRGVVGGAIGGIDNMLDHCFLKVGYLSLLCLLCPLWGNLRNRVEVWNA
eukprot:g10906.t1